jgi:hypothetical protein
LVVDNSVGFVQWLATIPWYAWIPIAAIICGAITGIFKMRYNHIERVAMIRQGMSPDAGKPGVPREV